MSDEERATIAQALKRAETAVELLSRRLRGVLRAVESFPLTAEHLAPLVTFVDAARLELREALEAIQTEPHAGSKRSKRPSHRAQRPVRRTYGRRAATRRRPASP
jgi:hypothetical protein